MEIKEFFASPDRNYWLEQIGKSEWEAGKLLYALLGKNQFKAMCGQTAKVYLLTDGDALVSFCTLAEKDDVRNTDLGPWIGFVFTFPQYRGYRYVGILLEHAFETAKESGAKQVYISTGETGLYEKYGYTFYQLMKDMHGGDSRVYKKAT